MTERLHENEARVEELTKNWTSKWRETQKIIEVSLKQLGRKIFRPLSGSIRKQAYGDVRIADEMVVVFVGFFINRSEHLASDMRELVLKWSQSFLIWSALMMTFSVQE